MASVTIYTKQGCSYCARAKALLDSKHVEFKEVKLDGQAALATELFTRVGRHTVPQIFIGDKHVGGCDDLYALEQKAALDALLAS
jgi:glutaredoxin 3